MPERRAAGLRARLTAFFVAITVVPLVLAVTVQQLQVRQELRERAAEELGGVQRTAVALLGAARARAGDLAGDLVDDLALDPLGAGLDDPDAAERADAFLAAREGRAIPDRADLMAVLHPDGTVLAQRTRPPSFAEADPGTSAAVTDPDRIAAAARGEAVLTGALLEVRELAGPDGSPLAAVVTGVWTDDVLLADLGLSGAVALVAGDEVLAVGDVEDGAVPVERPVADGELLVTRVDDAEVVVAAAQLLADGGEDAPRLLAWARQREVLSPTALAAFVLITALLAAALGALLASTVVGPLRRAAGVARAVAAGDLSRRLPPGGGRELTELSAALNTMGEQLRARMAELEHREEQLRGSLARLGETLSSSLDLDRTLAVVLDTAADTLEADAALLALRTADGDALAPRARRGLDAPPGPLPIGEGVLGGVAASAEALALPGAADAPAPGRGEPDAPVQLVVPLPGRGHVLGVLALYRHDPARPFGPADVSTLEAFATQAAVAIDNVRLHEEAHRQSVTDALTGLWNFRHFQTEAEREVRRVERSGRPLSLVVADIDHFKEVNDEHGHPVGDVVLAEVADRLRSATRAVDVVARYGGEEFVVLLPETGRAGAAATAERVRAAVGGEPVRPVGVGEVDPEPIRVTCSVGVATLTDPGGSVAALVRAADAAMYEAKQRGRDRVVVAGA